MKILRSVLLVMAGVSFRALPATATDTCCERPGITVVGEAEVRVVPDQAVLRLRVVTQEKDAVVAKTLNDQNVKATLDLARRFGVKTEHLQTSGVAIQPQWTTPREGGKPALIGYEVARQIVLVLDDLTRADALLTEVVKAGVNRVDGFELRASEPRTYKDQARAMAIRAAREKAVALTRELGQSIGKAFAISEQSEQTWGNQYQNSNRSVSFYSEGDESSFAAGQTSVRARVSVSFELQ